MTGTSPEPRAQRVASPASNRGLDRLPQGVRIKPPEGLPSNAQVRPLYSSKAAVDAYKDGWNISGRESASIDTVDGKYGLSEIGRAAHDGYMDRALDAPKYWAVFTEQEYERMINVRGLGK